MKLVHKKIINTDDRCIQDAFAHAIVFLLYFFRYGEKQRGNSSNELTPIQLLSATAYQMKKPYQQLLIVLTVYIGMEQAFIGAEFTQAYVSCALGIPQLGYVMICFGVVNALCSLLFGSAMKYIGRQVIIVFGTAVHTGLLSWLLIWRPRPTEPLLFFIASGLWGVGDAVFQTQINGKSLFFLLIL